ncbi:hypothetical protein Q7P35_006352 [Cladosporium inversicolor]
MDRNPTPTKTTRKRKRAGDSLSENSDDDLKKRGRPRTEKPDASAADRRRTQIRMAQRAYRQRKESTLDELRKRVSDLTNTVECMNQDFDSCRDRLVMAGLSEGQLDELSETALRFASYMSSVRNPGESHSDNPPEPAAAVSANANSIHSAKRSEEMSLVPKNVPSWMDEATLGQTGRRSQRPDIGMGYTMYTPDNFDPLVETFNIPTMAQAMQSRPFDIPSNTTTQPNGPTLPQRSLSISGELALPKTYSFNETTLGRRLHRACLEAAYHLLLDPVRKPHTFERVFRLSLLSRDRARMAAALKKVLARGLDDPLDFWEAPLLHIGGAGTHYPMSGRPISAHKNRSKIHLGIIGPQMLNLLDDVVQARLATDISVEVEGFEGTWFDPYDVEGYLESKGVVIDPSVSFAEAEITEPSAESSTASSRSSARTSSVPQSKMNTPFWDPEQWSEMQRLDADMVQWQDMENVQFNGLGSVGYSDANTGSWMNFQPTDPNQQKAAPTSASFDPLDMNGFDPLVPRYEQAAMPQKKVVIIDVAKFVKVLTVTGVCLGRTPGFKQKDVDRALAISSFDAF